VPNVEAGNGLVKMMIYFIFFLKKVSKRWNIFTRRKPGFIIPIL
jgi:hypothetical protein